MKHVNNQKVINNIALSGIRAKRKKYIILVLAVMLTSLLFSTLFSVGGSMVNEIQEGSMRQAGGSCHGGFKYLTEAEYDQMKDDPKLKSVSYRIMVGVLANEELKKIHTECYFAEYENAKSGFSAPTKGRMPEAEDEVVLSDLVLKALGAPCEVGSKVTLDVEIEDEVVEKEFTVCGYYEADPINPAQMVYVSKSFQEAYAPAKTIPLPRSGSADYVGRYSVDFNFSNSVNIESKIQALIARTGIREDVDYGVNWAYGASSLDPSMVIICLALGVVFMFAGYLIIFNIFDINIISDIQEFGLLKTIGTTEKQLKKIVMKRANMISLIGIPVGIGLGVLVAAILLPIISGQFDTVSVGKGQLHINVWMLLGAAVFSYITVVISAMKPCRKASKVSPVETVKYTEETDKNGKPKRKLVTVILSLSLALVVLNSVYGFVRGFSMDGYIENLVVADFSLQDASVDNPGAPYKETEAIDAAMIKTLSELDGVEEIGAIYLNRSGQEFDDDNWAEIEKNVLQSDLLHEKYKSYGYSEEDIKSTSEYDRAARSLDGKTYGIGKPAFDKLKVLETIDGTDTIDWDTFNSGRYVLMTRFTSDQGEMDFLKPGAKVQIRSNDPKQGEVKTVVGEDGKEFEYLSFDEAPVREYEVYGIVEIPVAMELRAYGIFECNYILPENEFLSLNGSDWGAMRLLMNVEDSKEAAVEEWLKDYTANVNSDMDYDSKESIVAEYASFGDMIKLVGAVVAGILGLIGLMNFANTMITSILVRSRELAMLEAVGMTGKQQKAKLMKEAMVYFVWTILCSVGVSAVLSVTLIRMLVAALPMFEWYFTLAPLCVCLPFICLMIVIIPVIAHERLSKRSVVDRLRVE
ncbi:MAG: ABC transporter permease [Lachnospiraceae bacterium]|nr:ABC transporter permease [Lachnospiraceae bacterium]